MKNTPYLELHKSRYQSEASASRRARLSPQLESNYQSSKLVGSCGTPAKFPGREFFKFTNGYFADEAPRGIAIDTAVFAALMSAAVLPIVNNVEAVATLMHGLGVL